MTGATVLAMLFGAGLVAIGVLASALADRIRGLRVAHRAAPAIEVIEPPKAKRAPVQLPATPEQQEVVARVAQGAPPSQAKMEAAAKEVIAALIAAGFKKPVAAEAVWSCGADDRRTIESWAAAALRRAGGVS